jgi:hypothetical protein
MLRLGRPGVKQEPPGGFNLKAASEAGIREYKGQTRTSVPRVKLLNHRRQRHLGQ